MRRILLGIAAAVYVSKRSTSTMTDHTPASGTRATSSVTPTAIAWSS